MPKEKWLLISSQSCRKKNEVVPKIDKNFNTKLELINQNVLTEIIHNKERQQGFITFYQSTI